MTGCMAAFLGRFSPRVRGVVTGGFPLSADYVRVLSHIRAVTEEHRRQPESWSEFCERHDPEAVLTYFAALAELPPAGLIGGAEGHLACFWAEDDEIIEKLHGRNRLERDLGVRRIPYQVLPGASHGELVGPQLGDAFAEALRTLSVF
jgi:hypothetical protein